MTTHAKDRPDNFLRRGQEARLNFAGTSIGRAAIIEVSVMVALDHNEAILFRLLASFFGKDRVIPHMSVMAICGGVLPQSLDSSFSEEVQNDFHKSVLEWARESKCLFTVVNTQDVPKLVIEFVSGFSEVIDLKELNRQRCTRPLLQAADVPYITVSPQEFSEFTNPHSSLTFFSFLQSKFEYSDAGL